MRDAFSRTELLALDRYLAARAKRGPGKPFRRMRDERLRVTIRGYFQGTREIPRACRVLFIPELANSDRSMAWRTVARGVLTRPELDQLDRLLRFQPPSKRLRDLVAAVEVKLSGSPKPSAKGRD